MKTFAIIPARGGSKGIPGKNIRVLDGKPLLAHTVEAALQAKSVQRVFVSTDDQAIAEVALAYGAEVIQRPADISGDLASSESALVHVLETLYKKDGYIDDIFVFLQCTCPLTLPEDIDGTVQALLASQADTAFTVAPSHYLLWEKTPDGDMLGINHNKNSRVMRQQCQNQFVETGAVYAIRTSGFLSTQSRFFGKTVGYEISRERYCDIDLPVDFLLAEYLLAWQKKKVTL
jgi:N-acylneuraminate cytidylyltransferase